MYPPLRSLAAALALCTSLGQPAAAHFLEIIPDADVLPEGGDVGLDLIFTHPFEGGPVMPLARPAAVGVLQNAVMTDLSATLTEAPGGTWRLGHALPEPGAAVYYVTPQPYWEPAEGKFIRHHAKVVVDSFASGTGWDAMIGLPVEIRPLTRPTGLWAGNLFSGVVTRNGAAVPFAEIEVEHVNSAGLAAPTAAHVTQVVMADANGTFHYAMPMPGWWGFAALLEGAAPMTAPDGRQVPVEEGALIWVQTHAMRP